MFGKEFGHTARHLIDIVNTMCLESGARRSTVTATRRSPLDYSVYVGHPISGIRVGRILEMQDVVTGAFRRANADCAQNVHCLFPMRTTHLTAGETGANEYEGAAALFSGTRHFTLQNRMDAVMAADAVLINFELKDDAGEYRVSKGIPFDYGWAYACGKPVVAVIAEDNPNACCALSRATRIVTDLEEGVGFLNSVLPHAPRAPARRVVADVFDFTGSGSALSAIAALAESDVQKHRDGGRAIIAVIPEGRDSPCWHGQIAQVADWLLPDARTAEEVVLRLLDEVGMEVIPQGLPHRLKG